MLRDLKIVNVFFGKKGVHTRDAQEVLGRIVRGAAYDSLDTGDSDGDGEVASPDADITTISDDDDPDTVVIR